MQPVSASDVPSKEGGEIPRPLSKDEILHIVKKYGEAAKRAQTAGFDAVEIHAGHSYLISQFLSPITNKRTDEFGGSVENRTRFCRMVIDEVRKQVGPFFPIMLRLSADELMEGGNTLEDTLEYLEYVQDEVDIFNDHTAETCSVFHRSAELICTFVCKRREELADQIGMSRMDFYCVKTCSLGSLCSLAVFLYNVMDFFH